MSARYGSSADGRTRTILALPMSSENSEETYQKTLGHLEVHGHLMNELILFLILRQDFVE